jgi:hypothetical protein
MVTRLLIACVLASTPVLLTACDNNNAISTPGTSVPAEPITLVLKKGYYAALSGAVGLERAAELAVDMGLLKSGSPTAVKVADLLVTLKRAMDAGDRALRAGDKLNLEANIRNINSTAGTIKLLLGIK